MCVADSRQQHYRQNKRRASVDVGVLLQSTDEDKTRKSIQEAGQLDKFLLCLKGFKVKGYQVIDTHIVMYPRQCFLVLTW